jgi:hypothetical protein
MDNLEKYILNNRSAFDTETPNPKVWDSVENRLPNEDTLEEFIQSNQADFDSETPRAGIWASIENQLSEGDTVEKFVQTHQAEFDTETPRADIWANIENRLSNNNTVEKFVQNNASQFDTEIPNLKVWANIENQLPQQTTKVSSPIVAKLGWWRQAAAAAILLLCGVGLGLFINTKKEATITQAMGQMAPELKETEQFYNKKIETKLTQYASYTQDPSVLADLKQVDEVQEELRKELENAPTTAREEIVKRLIKNYQIKLGILERVLNNINEHQLDNQKSQQQHESI